MDIDPPHATSKRRSKRPLLRIPIRVEGKNADGRPFFEDTHTLLINRNGGRICLQATVRAGDIIRITNHSTRKMCPFRVVVSLERSYGTKPEWGVECLHPETNFWGVYFPEHKEATREPAALDVLLQCATCLSREMTQLPLEKYRELHERAQLRRPCAQCGKTTDWRIGFVEVLQKEATAEAPGVAEAEVLPPSGRERRQTQRFVAMLPLRVRSHEGGETLTRTENLSKTGLCFISDMEMEEGDAIFLTVAPGGPDPTKEIPARVAWRRPLGTSGKVLYGVRLAAAE
jgi:hypothetical protein